MNYAVSEIYPTIQSEGFMAGTPCVIVRLQGCKVGCPFCDTKYSWGEKNMGAPLAARKLWWDEAGILDEVKAVAPHVGWILLTGGEPCEQDIHPLCKEADKRGYNVMLETSGTAVFNPEFVAHVCVSPKLDMPGGRAVLDGPLLAADEIKWVVGKEEDILKLNAFLQARATFTGRVYLQPMSASSKATRLCVANCLATGNRRLSVQTHKLLGLP